METRAKEMEQFVCETKKNQNETAGRIEMLSSEFSKLALAHEGLAKHMDSKFEQLFKLIQQPTAPVHLAEPSSSATPNSNQTEHRSNSQIHWENTSTPYRLPKLDFPYFDGTNPRSWVKKCEKYFEFFQVPEVNKVGIASIHLSGNADLWFLDHQVGNEMLQWKQFCSDLCERFEEAVLDNFVDSFNKLTQQGTVNEYFDKFEELRSLMLTHNHHLDEQYFVLSFLSGLKTHIKAMVQLFKPTTLTHAFSLARMHEASQSQTNNKSSHNYPYTNKPNTYSSLATSASKPPTYTSQFNHSHHSTYNSNSSHRQPPSSTTHNVSRPHTSIPPIKHLTPSQMRIRREKGLCYNCDEQYGPGHMCKTQHLYMLIPEENSADSTEDSTEVEPENLLHEDSVSTMDISLACDITFFGSPTVPHDFKQPYAKHSSSSTNPSDGVDELGSTGSGTVDVQLQFSNQVSASLDGEDICYPEDNISFEEFKSSQSKQMSAPAPSQKNIDMRVTFPCSKNCPSGLVSLDESNDTSDSSLHDESPTESNNAVCTCSLCLLIPLRPVSALKGSREKLGLPVKKLNVTWAPDVYDPPVNSLSHTVRSHNQQRSRSSKKSSKHKQRGKSSRGSNSEKHYRKHTSSTDYRSKSLSARDKVLLGGYKQSAVELMESPVTGQDSKCCSSFFITSLENMRISIAEAT